MRLAEVIKPIAMDEFCKTYLDKQWTIVSGPHERYGPLVPWSELNLALSRLRIPPRSNRLRLVKDGNVIPDEEYLQFHHWGSYIRTGALERQLSEGATLVLNGVDQLFAEVRDLAEDTDRVLGRYAWANLYSGWRTQRGFDLHWDDHDTMIFQVYGRKAWKVYAPTCEYPSKDFAASEAKPQSSPVWEGTLEAGSVLYMPRGWWHVAVPVGEPTLHVTLGIRPLVGSDLLHWLATQLPQHAVFRMNIPQRGGPAEQAAYLTEFRQAVISLLSNDCLDHVRHHEAAGTPHLAVTDLPGSVVREPTITADSVLFLASARGLEMRADAVGRLTVLLNGRQWTCSTALLQGMSRLSGVDGSLFADVSADLEPALLAELKALLTVMYLEGELLIRTR